MPLYRDTTGSRAMMEVSRRGCTSDRLIRTLAPKEWAMPIIGRGMEERKVLTAWSRSRAWSSQEAFFVINES